MRGQTGISDGNFSSGDQRRGYWEQDAETDIPDMTKRSISKTKRVFGYMPQTKQYHNILDHDITTFGGL